VHIIGFIIRIYHDAQSSECQNHSVISQKIWILATLLWEPQTLQARFCLCTAGMLNYVNKTCSEYSIHLCGTYSSELHTKCIKIYQLISTRYNLNTLHTHKYITVASGEKVIKIFCKWCSRMMLVLKLQILTYSLFMIIVSLLCKL